MKNILPYGFLVVSFFLMSIVVEPGGTWKKDENGLKQGEGSATYEQKGLPCETPNQVKEEGAYQDDNKVGDWKFYYCDGKVQEEGPYIDDRKNGTFKKYYPSGTIKQEGEWQYNVPKGNFTTYHPNGETKEAGTSTGKVMVGEYKSWDSKGNLKSEKNYNVNGKLEGTQVIYHSNGKVKAKFTTNASGKPVGTYTLYTKEGEIKKTMEYNQSGKIMPEKTTIYEVKESTPEPKVHNGPKTSGKLQDGSPAKCEGTQKLYNPNQDIVQDGVFKNCKLYNGKHYIYDANGLLKEKIIYKNGAKFSTEQP
jgi:antitoxin component YwqK of YwqJK toxin-antitoxin module